VVDRACMMNQTLCHQLVCLEDARFTFYDDEERREKLMLVYVACKGNQIKIHKR